MVTSTRIREFKYAENIDTFTIAALMIDEIELIGTRYFGKVYVGNTKGLDVAGPCTALRAFQITKRMNLSQQPFSRLNLSITYFTRRELIEHAIVFVQQNKMIEYLVLGNSFDDPNDCEVVWRRYPSPILNDEIPF